MKQLILTLLAIVTLCNTSFSQDLITTKKGEDLQVKVLEINIDLIKYKRFDNLNGPIFSIMKSDILMVRYENGTKDIFGKKESLDEKSANSDKSMSMKGKRDAELNYKGKGSGAGWTTVTTILFSPLIGLIPAAATASSEPSDSNLRFPSNELMQNYDYNKSYIEQAHRIKKSKIWKSFGIGSGVWLMLILIGSL
tara:strand:+ start:243 stop:827 length:585 start_codon:yes stop_codon:yes gene_type:complete